MNLYIAEKPSLGRAVAAALPKPHKKHSGYIETGNGDIVTWCIGHILEQADPEQYDERYKKWTLEHLPIIPEKWQLKVKYKTKGQLAVIRKHIKNASVIIHAGDPDREGQLLIDEVVDYLGTSKAKKANIKRLLINDLNISAVKRSLANMQSNSIFTPLSISALARSRADWLYGINLTRAYSIQGSKVGYKGVLSVGRVQTPILGLVVNRDRDIEHFTSKPFYEVHADIKTADSEVFSAKWIPSDACIPYQDEEGRVIVKGLAENVARRIHNQPASVIDFKATVKKQNPPLPYSLSALQIDAAKIYSMNAKLVLDVCQTLYEKYQLITYPRSDCRYLPSEHHKQSADTLNMLAQVGLCFSKDAECAIPTLKSKAWDNNKVSAHHAIVPTDKSPKNVPLNTFEKNVYSLIVRQFIAQFYPQFVYEHREVSLNIAGGTFKASSKNNVDLGWKALFPPPKKAQDAMSKPLPEVSKDSVLQCIQGNIKDLQTQAPKAFTDATLLSAISGISRYVKDKEIRAVLKETDGLGTEATRAGIIELLFKRQFLMRKGKLIHATDAGKGLVDALPEECTTADMTALWESHLNNIASQRANYESFMLPLKEKLKSLVNYAGNNLPHTLKGIKSTANPAFKKRRKFKKKVA